MFCVLLLCVCWRPTPTATRNPQNSAMFNRICWGESRGGRRGGSQGEKILRASMFVVFARRAAGTGFRGGQLPLASGKAWPPTETVGKHVAPCIGPASMAPSSGRGYATEFGSSRGHDHRIRPRAPQGFAGHRGVRMQRATTKTERTTDP